MLNESSPVITFNADAIASLEPTHAELRAAYAASQWLSARIAHVLHRWNKLADRSWGDPVLLSFHFQDDATLHLRYRYYSGGNEYDIDELTVPTAWLLGSNPDSLILAQLKSERIAQEEAEEAESRREEHRLAQQQAADEQAQIAFLRSKHPGLFKHDNQGDGQ